MLPGVNAGEAEEIAGSPPTDNIPYALAGEWSSIRNRKLG